MGVLPQLVGSQFLGHPPIAPYRVEITDPDHPLVDGVEAFDAVDELYAAAPADFVATRTRLAREAKGDEPDLAAAITDLRERAAGAVAR